MNKLTKLGITLGIAGMLFAPALSYAKSIGTSTTTIGYFYSISGTMIDAENSTGVMSSYLTRGIRYNGTGETFTVSNIKDVTGLVDADGNVLNKYTYTAYGVPTSYSSTSINSNLNTQNSTLSLSSNPYTYSNYYTDSESGNYYLNARYYDPALGVFLTSDTYNLLNNYMYVKGNPVMGVDPLGHIAEIREGTFLRCFTTHDVYDDNGNMVHWRFNRQKAENDLENLKNNKIQKLFNISSKTLKKYQSYIRDLTPKKNGEKVFNDFSRGTWKTQIYKNEEAIYTAVAKDFDKNTFMENFNDEDKKYIEQFNQSHLWPTTHTPKYQNEEIKNLQKKENLQSNLGGKIENIGMTLRGIDFYLDTDGNFSHAITYSTDELLNNEGEQKYLHTAIFIWKPLNEQLCYIGYSTHSFL